MTRDSRTDAPLQQALDYAGQLLAARPDLAVLQAEAILHAVADHPQALLILGAGHRRAGRTQEAAAVLRPLAQAQPNAAGVHHEWGLAQAEMGDPAGAVASLSRAVRLKPDLAQAWRALGDAHTLAGDTQAAGAAYAQHVRAGIHDPSLMHAASALCDNDLPRAEHLLRAHLRRHPTDVAALRMLAETGTRLGRDEDAERLLESCLRLAPSFSLARFNYALVLHRQGKAEAAIPHLQTLVQADPRDAAALNLLAASWAALGETDTSIAAYQAVLELAPNQPKIWLSYGHVLKTAGRRGEAVQAYRNCLSLAPGTGEAWWSLANLKNEPFSEADIAAMRTALAASGIRQEDEFHLHYALGAALERRAEYEHSFAHYAQGARRRRALIDYSAERTHAQLQRARALLTRGFFAERAGWGHQDAAPIFVVGLPRSGSTLIEQILASHSAIEGTAELPEITNIARDLRRSAGGSDTSGEDTYPGVLATLGETACAALGQRYLDRTRIYRKLGRRHFIDKLPNNFVHAGLIQLMLPNATIIDARRHPMAACFSAFKQHFARGQHYSYDLTELGRYYADYAALMAHYDQAMPGRVYRVDHERLVEDTEAQIRALLEHCGLEFEPACLRFHENTRAVRTASSEQVRRPITRDGLHQWQHYRPWLEPLHAEVQPLPGHDGV